jgi:hypothetical protein
MQRGRGLVDPAERQPGPIRDVEQIVPWIADDPSQPAAARRVLEQARPDVVFHLAGHVMGSQRWMAARSISDPAV